MATRPMELAPAISTIPWRPLLEHSSGLLSVVVQVWGLSQRDDSRLKMLTTVGAAAMVVNNLAVGSMAGAALSGVNTVRNWLSDHLAKVSSRRRSAYCCAFILASLVAGAAGGLSWLSVALTVSSCWATYAYFYLVGVPLRLALGSTRLVWLSNAVAFNSPWQLVSGLLGACAAFFGAWRIHRATKLKQV